MTGPAIRAVTVRPLHLPLRQPFITSRGQKTVSRNLLVTVTFADGTVGLGEASESLAWPEDSPQAMQRCLTQIIPRLIGQSPAGAWRRLRQAWTSAGASPAALSAAECAMASAEAASQGVPLWRWCAQRLGTRPRRPRTIATSLTISAWPPAAAGRTARWAAAHGFRQLKVKVTGRDPDQDLMRLVAVHRAAPRATLLVDANQGFAVRHAIAFSRAFRQFRLPVVAFEQPVPYDDLEGMAQLTRDAGVPIVADETVRTLADARRLAARRSAHVINVKLAKSGLIGALDIIRLATTHRLGLMIGCMAESAVGLAPSVHLACGTGAFRYVDLDSHLLVKNPAGRPAFTTRGPRLSVVG